MAVSAERLEAVRQAIEQAFSRLNMPKKADFVYSGYAPEDHQALMRSLPESIKQSSALVGFADASGDYEKGNGLYQLPGKRWQDLDEALILGMGFDLFYWLKPGAFRYYLPAYLTAALKRAAIDESILFSACMSLAPGYADVYFDGFDQKLRARQRIFSKAQYEAVCAFLGLALEGEHGQRFWAAYALSRGWNGIDTPELVAANAFRDMLRNYTLPELSDPIRSTLCHQIESAFANTPYPGDDQITDETGFADFEYAMIAVELRGLKWQNVHPELTARLHMALSFFTEAAFRYYLPAFLRADLLGCDSNADPVFDLTHGFAEEAPQSELSDALMEMTGMSEEMAALLREHQEKTSKIDWRAYFTARFSSFTVREREAIVAYLQYRAKDDENFDRDQILAALESYWLPSLKAMPYS